MRGMRRRAEGATKYEVDFSAGVMWPWMLYMFYIHPELRIENYCFRAKEGA